MNTTIRSLLLAGFIAAGSIGTPAMAGMAEYLIPAPDENGDMARAFLPKESGAFGTAKSCLAEKKIAHVVKNPRKIVVQAKTFEKATREEKWAETMYETIVCLWYTR